MSLFKKYKVILISLLIVILLTILTYVFVKVDFISRKQNIAKMAEENIDVLEKEEFSYVVYDNQEQDNIKILIRIESENEIEYIEMPEGHKIYANGKNKVSVDYVLKKNEEKTFKIKEIGEEIKEEKVLVTDEVLNQAINVNTIKESEGYKMIEITGELEEIEGFNEKYYQIGKNGNWIKVDGRIVIFDYDVTKAGLVNEDETITVTGKIVNTITGNIIMTSKDYKVDTSSTIDSIECDSIIQAVEDYRLSTGLHKVSVEGVKYNLKIYMFNESLNIEEDMVFGTEEDVATSATSYAKNMVVVKVNGDLTINEGVTVSPYSGSYGGPKGFFIYCTGTLTNNGTISNRVGANALGENVYLWKNSDNTYEYVPASGGTGGTGFAFAGNNWQSKNGNSGRNGTNRALAGGGSGSVYSCYHRGTSGSGANATSYSGGAGGGGAQARYSDYSAKNAVINVAGESSYAEYYSIGGAAGIPSAQGAYPWSPQTSLKNYKGENYVGGLLIIYTKNFVMNENGIINVSGGNAGNGEIGAGSSGGGSINVFYTENYTNNGTLKSSGGGTIGNRAKGGAGGTGSISVGNISTGTYESTYKNY